MPYLGQRVVMKDWGGLEGQVIECCDKSTVATVLFEDNEDGRTKRRVVPNDNLAPARSE